MNNNIIILIILSLLQFLVDICSNPCHTIIGYPILFLHHILVAVLLIDEWKVPSGITIKMIS